jgi:ATP-dependent exoDNAse (exonuclease V) beta subunit
MISNFETTYNSVLVLLKIVKQYLFKFSIIQSEENLFSYEDIMYYAIQLFQDFSDVKLKFKTKIRIMIIMRLK